MLRVLSDLHVLNADSRVQRIDALEPLFEDVDRLVLNGDTCDTENHLGADQVAAIVGDLRQRLPAVTFITGNHDPAISDVHELALADGAVWVTHGDIVFPDATPWSGVRREITRRIDAALGEMPETERSTLEARLRAYRIASTKLPKEFDAHGADLAARLKRTWAIVVPPTKVLSMIDAWRTLPRLAAETAARYRPSARYILTGHVHFPGIWRRPDGRVVINTGSFGPPRGPLAVDLDGPLLRVRRIDERRGAFHPGRVLAEFALAPTPVAGLSR